MVFRIEIQIHPIVIQARKSNTFIEPLNQSNTSVEHLKSKSLMEVLSNCNSKYSKNFERLVNFKKKAVVLVFRFNHVRPVISKFKLARPKSDEKKQHFWRSSFITLLTIIAKYSSHLANKFCCIKHC